MRRRELSIILTLFFVLSAQAEEELILESALNLKPTQAYVGMKSVEIKTKFFEKVDKEERHKYLKENPVPVIKGPNGEFFLVDHHHMSRSLLESDHRKLYIQVLYDWSDLSVSDFWEKMDSRGYAYLLNSAGQKISYLDLPVSVTMLQDDPFRSLAYFARKQGAYEKSPIPFAEFQWAAFYRTQFTAQDLETNWDETLKKALELSLTKEASNLPGYLGEFSCQSLF